MTNPYKIITIFTFLTLTFNQSFLNTQSSQSLQHVKAKNNAQIKFENQLSTINKKLSQIISIIQNSQNITGIQLNHTKPNSKKRNNQFNDIEKYLKIPNQLKMCKCKILTSDEQLKLQSSLIELNSSLNTLQQDINNCSDINCTNFSKIRQQVTKLRSYQDHAEQVINSDCCKKIHHFQQENASGLVDLSNTLLKDNLKGNNWYYGNITQQDYKLQMFQLTTKFNVSTCPQDQPFANIQLNQCHNCTPEGSMFNLGTRSCFYCNGLSYLNQTTSLCQQCPANSYYNSSTNACVLCTGNMYINYTSQKCQACPNGQFFNVNTSQCISCPMNYQYDQQSNICRLCNNSAGQFYNSTTQKCGQCPVLQFYNSNNQSCSECPTNSFFNYTLGKCDQCPQGYRFDNVYQLCVPQTNPNGTTICPIGQYLEPTTGKCMNSNNIGICPDNQPYYNITVNRCVPCPVGTTYDPQHYVCVNSQGQAISHLQRLQVMLNML